MVTGQVLISRFLEISPQRNLWGVSLETWPNIPNIKHLQTVPRQGRHKDPKIPEFKTLMKSIFITTLATMCPRGTGRFGEIRNWL